MAREIMTTDGDANGDMTGSASKSVTDATWPAPTGLPADLTPPSDGSADAATLTAGDLGPEVSGWSDRTRSDLQSRMKLVNRTYVGLKNSLIRADERRLDRAMDDRRLPSFELAGSGEKICDVVSWVLEAHQQHGELSDEQAGLATAQLAAISDQVTSAFDKFDFESLRNDIVSIDRYWKSGRLWGRQESWLQHPASINWTDIADRLGEQLSSVKVALENRLTEAHALVTGDPDAFRDAIRANISVADSTQ